MICGLFGLWPFRFVAVSVCGRSGLWPFRSVAVSVCGRFGLWPFRSVAISVCGRFGFGRFGLWPLWPEPYEYIYIYIHIYMYMDLLWKMINSGSLFGCLTFVSERLSHTQTHIYSHYIRDNHVSDAISSSGNIQAASGLSSFRGVSFKVIPTESK